MIMHDEILALAEKAGFRIPDDEAGRALLASRLVHFMVLLDRTRTERMRELTTDK